MTVEQNFETAFRRNTVMVGPQWSKRTVRLSLYAQLLCFDILALLAGPVMARYAIGNANESLTAMYPAFATLVVYLFLTVARGGYSLGSISSSVNSVRVGSIALGASVLLTLTVAFFLGSSDNISRLSYGLGEALAGCILVAGRLYFPRHARNVTKGMLLEELVITHGKSLDFTPHGATVMDANVIGLTPDLHDPIMLSRFGAIVADFDRVVIFCRPEFRRAWSLLLKGANVNGEIAVEPANETGAIAMAHFHGLETLLVSRQPLSLHSRLQKRLLDLALCIPILIVMAPLLVVVAILVKLDSKGPVFFRQQRVGRGNRLFSVMKFRSMRVEGCDANGSRSTSRTDDRVTRVGRIIRATSIDELPQLLNVLNGDMSLVGPRPHALGSQAGNKLFWQIDETYWLRHQLKPGITGLAQVRGFRGATVRIEDLTSRLQADMEYIQGWNIWRDLAILFNTARVIWHPNAY